MELSPGNLSVTDKVVNCCPRPMELAEYERYLLFPTPLAGHTAHITVVLDQNSSLCFNPHTPEHPFCLGVIK